MKTVILAVALFTVVASSAFAQQAPRLSSPPAEAVGLGPVVHDSDPNIIGLMARELQSLGQ